MPEHLRPIDRLGQHDRTDRVVEIEMITADQRGEIRRQGVRREWPGRDDHRIAFARLRIVSTSSRTMVMSGCSFSAAVIVSANRSRSTASAALPGRGSLQPRASRATRAGAFLL